MLSKFQSRRLRVSIFALLRRDKPPRQVAVASRLLTTDYRLPAFAFGFAVASCFLMLTLQGCKSVRPDLYQDSVRWQEKVYTLKAQEIERARSILSVLEIETETPVSETNGLLVKGSARDLRAAAVVLDLIIDGEDSYLIESLGSLSAARGLPSNEQMARAIGNLALGTFSDPPGADASRRAIIDIGKDQVWAIATAEVQNEIRGFLRGGARSAPVQATETRALGEPSNAVASKSQSDVPNDQSQATASSNTETAPDTKVSGIETALPAQADVPMHDIGSAGPATTRSGPDAEPALAPAPEETASMSKQPAETKAGQAVSAVEPETESLDVTIHLAAQETGAARHKRSQERIAIHNGDNIIELTLPEKLSLIQLIDLAGQYLGLDYLYDPQKISDEMLTLKLHGKHEGKMRVRDLYALLETTLKFKGLAMTRRHNDLVAIVPIAEALEVDPELLDADSAALIPGDMIVTREFELQYVEVASIVELLNTMKLSIAATPIAGTGIVYVTCYSHRMARIEELLERVDQPGKPKVVRFRLLRHTEAKTLAGKLHALAAQVDTFDVSLASGVTGRPAAPAAPQGQKPSQIPARVKETVYLDADERTNRILMVGTEEQVQALEQLVDALDVVQQDRRFLRIYAMAYADVQDVADKLQQLQLIGTTSTQSSGTQRRPAGAPPRPPQSSSRLNTEDGGIGDLVQAVLVESSNSLLVNATVSDHERLAEVISYLDVPQQDTRIVKVYPITYVDAQEVEDKLIALNLVGGMQGMQARTRPVQGRLSASKTQPAQPVGPGLPVALGPEAQVVVLEVTNSLLVKATEAQHAQIEEIIVHVDMQTHAQAIPYEIYFLENQSPKHMGEILQKIIQGTVESDPEDKIEKTINGFEDQIIIVPDEMTFSLIVYASRKHQEWISKLVEKLDRRRPQVLIDVTLVEIKKTDEFTYDLNIIRSWPDLVETGGQTGAFVTGGQTVVEKLLEPGMRDRFIDFQSDSGLGTGFYADTHVQALLTAMHTKNYGRVLAKPKILVNDNEKGSIKTTDTTYVTKTSSIPVTSGAGGTETSLIETAVDYQGYDAGITLEITPHTSEGDLLQLEIVLTRSDFGIITGETPPDTSANDLNTIVTVPDGSTIILGGMLRLNQTKAGTKVPILGDIPLLGALFRGVSNKDIQNKLYVFVRAEIIRPEETILGLQEDLKQISDRNREAFEEHEKEFQDYESWPGIKPKPTQPEKVLDFD